MFCLLPDGCWKGVSYLEKELNLYGVWEVIAKRWLLILAIPLLAVLIGALINIYILTPQYRSTTSLLVMKPTDTSQILYQDIQVSRQLVDTYREIAHSRLVLDGVISSLNLSCDITELRKLVQVESVRNTEIINISVVHPQPAMAKNIANTVARNFMTQVVDLYRVENVSLIDRAALPKEPVSPKVKQNLAVAFSLGLIIAVGLVFLLDNLDRTIKTPEDIQKYLQIPVLGIIPRIDS